MAAVLLAAAGSSITLQAADVVPSMVADPGVQTAVRGARRQETPVAPPPSACVPGTLVEGVNVGSTRVIAFTFDDGPWPVNTQAVMKAFEARGLRATFFLLGNNAITYPAIARDVANRGHQVGNHAMTHSYVTSTNIREVLPAAATLERITGVRPAVYRAPGLATSPTLLRYLGTVGYCNVNTDVVLGDHLSPRLSASTLCSRFASSLHPGQIVLLHDGGSHTQTVSAVPCMLDIALARGYQIVTLSELLALGPTYAGVRPYGTRLDVAPGVAPCARCDE